MSSQTTILSEKYEIPREYIKSVISGHNRAFIFTGPAGMGKTYLTRQVLEDNEAPFIENRGVNSPLALYRFLFENNREEVILVFDDTVGLINNPNAYSILLNVLWEGWAEWNSTTEKLKKIPKKFAFVGKIIFITNKVEGEHSDTIKSRCLVYNLNLTNEEIIAMMYEIAKLEHKSLTADERKAIVAFIQDNTGESTLGLDLRTQQKIEQLYLYDKLNWQKLAKPLIVQDNDMELLIACVKSAGTINEAQKEWSDKTGFGRRTFFLKKKGVEIK